MPRRLHRKKRRKTSIKFGLLFLLALILVGSGIYVEHVRTEQAASEKKVANAPETLPKTSTTFTNQQSIEPKNTLSASIEQSLVEKDFSGTVLVFHHGQVILNKAYGWKNQSKRIRNTINTQYCIGSIQKGQTAYLIMQAIKAGKITMDEKLSAFFPEIPNSDNISIKDMLNMSSGLRIDEKKINALNTTDTKEILNATVQQTTVAPTASYSYQPVNYVLLAGVLEKVYQSDYDHLFEKLLKEPMGLGETSFYSASNTAQALSYSQNVGNPIYAPTTASSYADELGTGNVFMTSSDLYHYFRNLFDPHFLTTEERTDLLYTYPGEKYASGLYDMKTYYHARGVKARFEAVANFSKDGQNGIILLSNVWNQPKGYNDFAGQLYKRIAASV
ncbi:serine hydrolase [uncultured Enterococcus sp.]|uniref:serine hydrolase domain-containing protein n=1 Tax=uncultured Enterococcus sp. TaxID=167972 RepID=UPI002582CFEE|nr:serine hydrolase [uncultured Enterococcus sp.]